MSKTKLITKRKKRRRSFFLLLTSYNILVPLGILTNEIKNIERLKKEDDKTSHGLKSRENEDFPFLAN